MSVRDDFDAAVIAVKQLSKTPSSNQLLELYGLFKQATTGDAKGGRPGMLDLKGRAKYDAWEGKKGMTAEAAMAAYTALVGKLRAG